MLSDMTDPVARLHAALESRYAIERELGEGGMATGHLAGDLKHQRKVALKVLKPESRTGVHHHVIRRGGTTMRVISMLGVAAAALIAFVGQANSLAAQDGPLFASHNLVALTIHAPFEDIFEHRGQESEEPEHAIRQPAVSGPS